MINRFAVFNTVLCAAVLSSTAILQAQSSTANLQAQQSEVKNIVLVHGASLLRFRPIMMATMAALLGAVPLAFGKGVGSELRRPLGITIIGGLLLSQLLTLYTTPVIYLFFDNIARRFAAFRKRHGFGEAAAGPAPGLTPETRQ